MLSNRLKHIKKLKYFGGQEHQTNSLLNNFEIIQYKGEPNLFLAPEF
jgi:hypothetical protein